MKRSTWLLGLSALAVSAVSMSAHAGGSDPAAAGGLAYLSELNLIVLGNMTGGADVEGKTFVAGNITNGATFGGGASANPGQGYAQSSFLTVTVGGNLSGSNNVDGGITPAGETAGGDIENIGNLGASVITLQAGGYIGSFNASSGMTVTAGGAIGDSGGHPNGATINAYQGPTYGATLGIAADTNSITADLKALSTALSNLTPVGGSFNFTNPSNYDQNNLDMSSNNTAGLGYAVIDMTATQFELLHSGTAKYSFDASIPTIINVTGGAGSTLSFGANPSTLGLGPEVLWNFVDATSLSTGGFAGSILAPYASLANSDQINGSVAVGGNFNQGGEVHLGTFQGSAALTAAVNPATSSPTSGVPEPAAWTMMITGVGLMGLALRRRRARDSAGAIGGRVTRAI